MNVKPNTILFVSSFLPVIVFKIMVGLGKPFVAVTVGLILAVIQFGLSKRILKHTTYLERAFLGFLGFGLLWMFFTPTPSALLLVKYSTALLYFVLFLTTVVPQVLGYDPFTYAIAKQWYPESVWNTPQFREINLHITTAWSCIFFVSFILCWAGTGKILFSIVLPLILILGIGLPFSRMYPNYYLKREFSSRPVDLSGFPATARELVIGMPKGFDPSAAGDLGAEIQFDLLGEGGGKTVLSISQGRCAVREGETRSPTLRIQSPADVWLKIARGEINRPKALMDGLFKVEGDMNLLMRLGELFHPPASSAPPSKPGLSAVERVKTGEKGMVKILAVQGSPRPKVSNTEVLLQQFLKGAESQGAATETIYLKEKEIHSCVGCFTCWTKTPGVCVFKDDMPELLGKVRECDILVYATPLYNFNVTSLLKAFQERLLPLLDPHLVKNGDTYRHPQRHEMSRRMVLISNCGFPEVSHFDGLRHVFRHLERSGEMPLVGEILAPAGELLRNQGLKDKLQPVLEAAYQAGVEVVREGRVSKETEAKIQRPVISPEDTAGMANLWWDSQLEGISQGQGGAEKRVEDIRILLKGMSLLFNPQSAPNLKAVIQFEVTGKQPGTWFLSIENGKCFFNEGKAESPSLTIKTPSEIWLAIAGKEMDGQKAFMEGKYTAQGDMALMMRMRSLFSSQT